MSNPLLNPQKRLIKRLLAIGNGLFALVFLPFVTFNIPKNMSHFSNIKTQIRNLTSLKAALKDMGIDWKEGPHTVRGYQGQTRKAQIVVEQENNYDIGFSWNGSEYELIADLQYWQQPLSVDGFLKKVTQGYALHTILDESAKQGFQVAQQQKNEDGSIRLVVQRWSA